MFSQILSFGTCLPAREICNNFFVDLGLDTSDEWIFSRTGIKSRRWVVNETNADLAYNAAFDCLSKVDFPAHELDLIIVATCSPDQVFPGVAVKVQHMLGAFCPAFDINAVCSGFVYGLSLANSLIISGQYQNVLLIGSETLSKLLDLKDRSTAILFGDGAGAFLLRSSKISGIIKTKLYAKGEFYDILKAGKDDNGGNVLTMVGNAVFREGLKIMEESARFLDLSAHGVDFLIPHQANYRMTKNLAKTFALPDKKVVNTITYHGNTAAASIPLAFAEVADELKQGDIIAHVAAGAGMAGGGVLWQVTENFLGGKNVR